jgi:hypothetical protein
MPSSFTIAVRSAAIAALIVAAPLGAARAQGGGTMSHVATRPAVCTDGVALYHNLGSVPTPFDTLAMPPSEPIRVSSPEEAAAAERMMLQRAGSIGATGVLMTTMEEETADGLRMHRSVTPVFAPGDTARAYAACRKKS